jgi:signal transduction histidine kinase/CheY-like chemotaxis protein
MSVPILTLEIRFEMDVVSVRQRARQISGLLGFDTMEQARIATAVSEIARNALSYGGGGTVEFLVEEAGAGRLLSFLVAVRDRGPGIPDLAHVLEGRSKSSSAAGKGIVSARRLMDTFEIDSTPGHGTVVLLGKRFPKHARSFTARDRTRIASELGRDAPQDPFQEIRQQNQELGRAMDELRARQEDLMRLNRELEDTNRGVVALYAELDEKALHLRRADELKSRFLSNMSHEFRTPLNSITALCRLLLDQVDGTLSDEQRKQVNFILKNAHDLSELVNDLLDLAKVEAGRITVTPAETEVSNLFAALRGMFRPLLTNNNVKLIFEEPAGVPQMYTDEGKISQILRNFISNSLKFTEFGEVRVAATLDCECGEVVFSVTDTGIGIAPEHHERIFDEFTQVEHPIQKRVKGTGLGLPLARKLAQLLGGRVTMESEPGAGSTFRAHIPSAYRSGHRVSDAAPRTEPDSSRFPVLVVEDNEETILLYDKYLKGSGFQILPARTTGEARELMQQLRPVAIVLDLVVPGNDAWDFLIEMKRDEERRDIPIYVVSVLDEIRKGFALGADDYCVKPMARQWLLDKLRKIVIGGQPRTALVVDDDEVSRYLLRGLLTDTRYRVIEAPGGAEGLRRAREDKPDVIFLDLVMPEVAGIEVLKQLRRDSATRGIPVVVVTAKTLDDDERRYLTGRTVAVLPKESSSRAEAVAAIRDALRRAEAGGAPNAR